MTMSAETARRRRRALALLERSRGEDTEWLVTALGSTDPLMVMSAAAVLAEREDRSGITQLRDLLAKTADASVRNAVALALGKLGDEFCVPILARLLTDPKTAGNRGTLLYALRSFDVRPLFSLLVDLALTDNFEVQCTALDLIDDMEGELDGDLLQACLARTRCAGVDSDERRETVEWLLDWFDDLVPVEGWSATP